MSKILSTRDIRVAINKEILGIGNRLVKMNAKNMSVDDVGRTIPTRLNLQKFHMFICSYWLTVVAGNHDIDPEICKSVSNYRKFSHRYREAGS